VIIEARFILRSYFKSHRKQRLPSSRAACSVKPDLTLSNVRKRYWASNFGTGVVIRVGLLDRLNVIALAEAAHY